MRRLLTLLTAITLLSLSATYAQSDDSPKSSKYSGKYLLPSFKKGWDFQHYKDWVVSNIVYPQEAIDAGIEGRVVVAFIIEESGRVVNAVAMQSPNEILSNELIRVVKSGKWYSSAKEWDAKSQRYKSTKMRSVIPITFSLPLKKSESNEFLTYEMLQSGFSEN